MTRRGLIAVSAAALLAACSRLALFNRLTPKDRGGRLAAEGVAYGPDPRQRLDVYVPVRPAAGPAPVVVFFYGGNWTAASARSTAGSAAPWRRAGS
jgi:acetyl esterase/lipase